VPVHLDAEASAALAFPVWPPGAVLPKTLQALVASGSSPRRGTREAQDVVPCQASEGRWEDAVLPVAPSVAGHSAPPSAVAAEVEPGSPLEHPAFQWEGPWAAARWEDGWRRAWPACQVEPLRGVLGAPWGGLTREDEVPSPGGLPVARVREKPPPREVPWARECLPGAPRAPWTARRVVGLR
jgi:hypothetical protein